MLDSIDKKFFKMAVGHESIGKETDVDIAARCPVCGDSRKNKRMKRLHLYNKGNVTGVNCFNGDCGVHNKTMYGFLHEFFPALVGQYKREKFGSTLTKLASGDTDVFSQFKKEEHKIEKEKPVLTQDLSEFFTPYRWKPEAQEYIASRGIKYEPEKYGEWYYGPQDLKIGEVLYKTSNSVIIPLYYEGEMYGFYSRNIEKKDFSTYMRDANIGYKVWNWFNVDKAKPVYIFEGIFDAIASGLPNVIALMGAKLPEERLKELKQPVFVLDNDRTGLMNSLEYCKKARVYIQPLLYKEKDMNELMKNHSELNIPQMIQDNLYSGIMAEVKIKSLL